MAELEKITLSLDADGALQTLKELGKTAESVGNNQITNLAKKLEKLGEYPDELKSKFSAWVGAMNQGKFGTLTDEFKELTRYVDSASSSVDRLSETLEGTMLGNVGNSVSESMDKEASAVDRMASATNFLKNKLSGLISKLKSLKKGTDEAGESAKKTSSFFDKFANRIKSIITYRFIRGGLSKMTQYLQEGIQNLVKYEQAFNGLRGSRATEIMTELSTSLQTLKNNLGAMAVSVLGAVQPAIETLISWLNYAVNAINQLFVALQGGTTYKKATNAVYDYAKALSTAKKQSDLLSFDELNRLSGESGSNSGGTSYYDMFTDAEISPFFTNLKATVESFGFDWDNITKDDIMTKLKVGLNGITGALIGWELGGVNGALVGSVLGVLLGLLVAGTDFDWNKITGDGIMTLLESGLNGITGAMIGWEVGGAKGAVFGGIAGVVLGLLTSSILFEQDGKVDEGELKTMLYNVIGAIVGGALGIWTGVGAIKGALLGFSIVSGLQLLVAGLNTDGQCKYNTIESFLTLFNPALSAMFGGLAGLEIGKAFGVKGAVIGFVIGTVITFAVTSAITNKDGGNFEDMLVDSNTGVFDVDPAQYETKQVVEVESKYKFKALQADRMASGGTPDVGTLFWAGEAGAEVIGSVGGRTTVYNTDQLGTAMATANADVVQAINNLIGVVQRKSGSVTISSSDIRKAVNSSSMRLGV